MFPLQNLARKELSSAGPTNMMPWEPHLWQLSSSSAFSFGFCYNQCRHSGCPFLSSELTPVVKQMHCCHFPELADMADTCSAALDTSLSGLAFLMSCSSPNYASPRGRDTANSRHPCPLPTHHCHGDRQPLSDTQPAHRNSICTGGNLVMERCNRRLHRSHDMHFGKVGLPLNQ